MHLLRSLSTFTVLLRVIRALSGIGIGVAASSDHLLHERFTLSSISRWCVRSLFALRLLLLTAFLISVIMRLQACDLYVDDRSRLSRNIASLRASVQSWSLWCVRADARFAVIAAAHLILCHRVRPLAELCF